MAWIWGIIALVAVVLVAAMARARYLFSVSVAKGHGIFVLEARSVSILSALNVLLLLLAWFMGASLQVLLALYVRKLDLGVLVSHDDALLLEWARLHHEEREIAERRKALEANLRRGRS